MEQFRKPPVEESTFFNLGLDTLKRIAELIDMIGKTSIQIIFGHDPDNNPVDKGHLLKLKYALIKQLYTQSFPLLNPKERDAIEKLLDKIRFQRATHLKDETGRYEKLYLPYSPQTDRDLDEIEKQVQSYLAEKGVFMPRSSDVRQAWRQSETQ